MRMTENVVLYIIKVCFCVLTLRSEGMKRDN